MARVSLQALVLFALAGALLAAARPRLRVIPPHAARGLQTSTQTASNAYADLRPSWWPRKLPAGKIVTLLGNGYPGGNGGPATAAAMSFLTGGQVTWDVEGTSVLIAEPSHHRARRITGPNITVGGGRITTLAGADAPGVSGDGDSATSALLNAPMGIAGNQQLVYVSDSGNSVIRRIELSSSIIATVAGTRGRAAFNVTPFERAATSASFSPGRLALDRVGTLYVIANDCRVLRLAGELLSLFAGSPGGCSSSFGDGGPATSAGFVSITHVAAHDSGAVYIVDQGARLLRRVDGTSRVVSTIVGSGDAGSATATLSGPALSVALFKPKACAVAPDGSVYILSSDYSLATAMHIIDAGSTAVRPLPSAWMDPMDVSVHPTSGEVLVGFRYQGNYISRYNRVTGALVRVAGTGQAWGGDGGSITDADEIEPVGAVIDPFYNLWVLSGAWQQDTLRVVANTTAVVSTVHGLYYPHVLSVDNARMRVCYADTTLRCQGVGPAGALGAAYPVAGGGSDGSRDGSLALSAGFDFHSAIFGIAFHPTRGMLVFSAGGAVRCVHPENGTLCTVISAGGFAGDGGPARSARVQNPHGLLFDPSGALLVADAGNGRVRSVSPDGVISTLAGGGPASLDESDGDFGPATSAHLRTPVALALAPGGDTLYIAEQGGHRVRALSLAESAYGSSGIVYTVSGVGAAGFGGESEHALQALLNAPVSLHVAPWGDVLLSDRNNNRVRALSPLTPCLGFTNPLLRGVCGNVSDPRSLECAWGDAASGFGCRKCPAGALCIGGRLLRPRRGYYVASELSTRVERCAAPADSRCLGWDARLSTTACGVGYRRGSPGCGACAPGYYPARDSVCTECPAGTSPYTAALYVLYLLLALAVFSLLLTLVARRLIIALGGGTVGGVLSRSAQLLTWMFELFQVQVAVSSSFGPGLPPAPRAFYENLRIFSFDGLGPPPACTGGPFPAATGLLACVTFLLGLLAVVLLIGGRDGVVAPPSDEGAGGLLPSAAAAGAKPTSTSEPASACDAVKAPRSGELPASALPPSPVSTWRAHASALSGHLLTLVGLLYCAVASSTVVLLSCTPVEVTKAGYLALDGDGSALWHGAEPVQFDDVVRVHVLVGYPNVVCGEGRHPAMATWATAMLVGFVVGFPLLQLAAARAYTASVMPARVGQRQWAEARSREPRAGVARCGIWRLSAAPASAPAPLPPSELLLRRPGLDSPRSSVAGVLTPHPGGSARAASQPQAPVTTATALMDTTLPRVARGVAARHFAGDLRASASWVAQVELFQLALLSAIGVAWVPVGEQGADVARYIVILLSLLGVFALYWCVAPFKPESQWMAWAKLLHLTLLLLTNLLGAVNSVASAQVPPSAGLVRARDDLAYALLAFSVLYIVGLLAAFVRSLYVELAAAARIEADARRPLQADAGAPDAAHPPPSDPFRVASILGDPAGAKAQPSRARRPSVDASSEHAPPAAASSPPAPELVLATANPLFALRHERPQPGAAADPPAAAACDLDPQPSESPSPREAAMDAVALAEPGPARPALQRQASRAQRSAAAYGLRRASTRGRAAGEDVSSDHNVTIRYIGQQRIAVRR